MAALHERLVFDTARGQVLDDTRRYVLLRADVLMGLFEDLPEGAREAALQAFARSAAAHGSDSVRAYRAAVGTAGLPAMMESAAASLGWGRWRFDVDDIGNPSARRLRLDVENSPFAAAAPRGADAVCHAIAGLLEGLASVLWYAPAEAREIACAARHGGGTCRFIAGPRAAGAASASGLSRTTGAASASETPLAATAAANEFPSGRRGRTDTPSATPARRLHVRRRQK